MIYVYLTESIVLLFFLCRLLDGLYKATIKDKDIKPLKIKLTKPKNEETEEERKLRLTLENIDNYGTDKAQNEVK